MVEGLLLLRPAVFGDGKPPLLGVGKGWVDVEDDAAKRIKPMAHDLTHPESGLPHMAHVSPRPPARPEKLIASGWRGQRSMRQSKRRAIRAAAVCAKRQSP